MEIKNAKLMRSVARPRIDATLRQKHINNAKLDYCCGVTSINQPASLCGKNANQLSILKWKRNGFFHFEMESAPFSQGRYLAFQIHFKMEFSIFKWNLHPSIQVTKKSPKSILICYPSSKAWHPVQQDTRPSIWCP